MADAHDDTPDVPGLPEIQDEAADTPRWVPITGLFVLVTMALYLVAAVVGGGESAEPAPATEDSAAAVADDPGAGDGEEAPAEEAEEGH